MKRAMIVKINRIMVPILALAGLILFAVIVALTVYSQPVQVKAGDEKSYTITFEKSEIKYNSKCTDLMKGVKAQGDDGEDLTQWVNMEIKSTDDIRLKRLCYRVDKKGYEKKNFERQMILCDDYDGPVLKTKKDTVKISHKKIDTLCEMLLKTQTVTAEDGFGNRSCKLTASFGKERVEKGTHTVTITAENHLGDKVSKKIKVVVA